MKSSSCVRSSALVSFLLLTVAQLHTSVEAACCFRIGYGAMMVPCCLTTEEGKSKAECLPQDDGGGTMVGGAIGWDEKCPATAEAAHALIQAAQNDGNNAALITPVTATASVALLQESVGDGIVRQNLKKRRFHA